MDASPDDSSDQPSSEPPSSSSQPSSAFPSASSSRMNPIAEALKACVMVRVSRKDSRRRRARSAPFFAATKGRTYLSSSGVVLAAKEVMEATWMGQNRRGKLRRPHPFDDTAQFVLCDGGIFINGEDIDKESVDAGDEIEARTHDGRWWKCELLALSCDNGMPGEVHSGTESTEFDISRRIRTAFRTATVNGSDWTSRYPRDHLSSNTSQDAEATNRRLGVYALLQLKERNGIASAPDYSLESHLPSPWQDHGLIELATQVFVISSPYGLLSEHIFANSVQSGIVSSSFDGSGLILTDARCFPGSEGGAVVTRDGRLVGLVCGTIAKGTLVRKGTLTLVADWGLLKRWVVQTVAKLLAKRNSLPTRISAKGFRLSDNYKVPKLQTTSLKAGRLGTKEIKELGVMCITVGGTWGSCFAVSENGYILTNRHVFSDYLDKETKKPFRYINCRVRVGKDDILFDDFNHVTTQETKFASNSEYGWFQGSLQYVSPDPWDFAVVKVNLIPASGGPNSKRQPRLRVSTPIQRLDVANVIRASPGDSVYVIGYPIFAPETKFRASVTSGVMSKILSAQYQSRNDKVPVALVSTAAVHQGNSGGMLVDAALNFLGIATCNMAQATIRDLPGGEEDLFPAIAEPRINLSIANTVLYRVVGICKSLRFQTGSEKERYRMLNEILPNVTDESNVWNALIGNRAGQYEKGPGPTGSGKQKFQKIVERISRQKKDKTRAKL